ncbi:MAG TPA: heme-binding protein [Actinomycetes bacterium]|nr:heme-binding protein [Actinomycetes bacterium]
MSGSSVRRSGRYSIADTVTHLMLTHEGALHVLQAAVDRAAAMGTPQCVAVVDDSGSLLAFVRMDGAKVLSIQTAQRKALTAADRRSATGGLEPGHDLKLALVTEGRLTNLKGGLPIIVGGQVLGAVGVSSGSGEEDLEVAKAGVAAIPGAKTDW